MGFLDNLFSDPFDLDNNGKRTIDEDFIEYMMFKEIMYDKSDEVDEDEDIWSDSGHDDIDEADDWEDDHEYRAATHVHSDSAHSTHRTSQQKPQYQYYGDGWYGLPDDGIEAEQTEEIETSEGQQELIATNLKSLSSAPQLKEKSEEKEKRDHKVETIIVAIVVIAIIVYVFIRCM